MRAARQIGNNVAEIGKAGTFTQGLLPAIFPLAVLGSQSNLDNAIESAKQGEMSAIGNLQQIRPSQDIRYQTDNTGMENKIFREMKKEKTDRDMDDLTKQMERLVTLVERQGGRNGYRNYGRREKYGNYGRREDYNGRGENTREVECWTCHEKGHYSTECPNRRRNNYRNDDGRNNNRNNRNGKNTERSLNFLRATYEEGEALEYDNSSDSEYTDEDERQVFLETRSGRQFNPYNKKRKIKSESKKEKTLIHNDTEESMDEDEEVGKTRQKDTSVIRNKRTEALQKARNKQRQKNVCSRCGTQGHFGTECPRIQCTRCGEKGHEWNRCPTYPVKKNPRKKKETVVIEEKIREKYEFAKYIMENLPRVSLKETMKHVPGYEEKLYNIVQKHESGVNFLERIGEEKFNPITCEINIQGVNTEAIIDTGAGATVMTRGMMEDLPYEIDEPSNINLVDFGKGKFRSLGRIKDMNFFIGNTRVLATVDVVDLPHKILLLGTDWLSTNRALVDCDEELLVLKRSGGNIEIPIRFLDDEGSEQEEYEDEETRQVRF